MSEALLTAVLSDLVAIPSVNPMGQSASSPNSLAVVEYVEVWLRNRGIDCTRQVVAPGEANLVAVVAGRRGTPTIVFDAHTDTAPVSGWPDAAFVPRLQSGRLFGRGACDAKGALAAMMVALADAVTGPVENGVILLASADEEHGRTGLRTFLEAGASADCAVVGEPTSCLPATACKGAMRCDIVVSGHSAHTSRPEGGINAIRRMGEVMKALDQYDCRLQDRRHPLVGARTLTPSLIHGGAAVNVVPDACRLTIDCRTLPDDSPAEILSGLEAFLADRLAFPVEFECVQLWDGLDVDGDHPFVQHCVAAARSALGTDDVQAQGVHFGCHASDYMARGIVPVVLGPGSIEQAHRVDEFVPIVDLVRIAEVYRAIITRPLPGWAPASPTRLR